MNLRFQLANERGTEADEMYRTSDDIEHLFNSAISRYFSGKPITIGKLTLACKKYLEKISGLTLKKYVDFVLNPSDLVHIYRRHFGSNENDGRNIPPPLILKI